MITRTDHSHTGGCAQFFLCLPYGFFFFCFFILFKGLFSLSFGPFPNCADDSLCNFFCGELRARLRPFLFSALSSCLPGFNQASPFFNFSWCSTDILLFVFDEASYVFPPSFSLFFFFLRIFFFLPPAV